MTLEQVVNIAKQLSPSEQVQLIERITPQIKSALMVQEKPRQSLYGIFAHLGEGPSEQDIEQVRAEMWENFPRNDI